MRPLSDIEQRIAHTFANIQLLEHALTHKSYANENRLPFHNERMEFLGDSILNLVVSDHLMKTCPEASEGDLSKHRAVIVSEPSLASIARTIGLGSYLMLGKGEEQTGGRDKDSLLADCLEALIASVYLDAGIKKAEAFVLHFFNDIIGKICSSNSTPDFKTKLQERCQERIRQLPEYRVVSETGPDHQKEFAVEILVQGTVYGRGAGRSKKEAEQRAAEEALKKLSENSS